MLTLYLQNRINKNLNRKIINNQEYIFDPARKKYFLLTPEEWVRQQIVHYFIGQLNYPLGLLSVEKKINVGGQVKRYDILVYKDNNPWLIVECKREDIKLTKKHLSQIESYVSTLTLNYFAISNGNEIHCFDVINKCWNNHFPIY